MRFYLLLSFFILLANFSFAQLACNAGPDVTICPGTSTTIGANPAITGGVPPYTITWAPATGLSSTTIQNPTVTTTNAPITYTLTVKDSRDSAKKDSVTVFIDAIFKMDAGTDKGYCSGSGSSVSIGNSANYSSPYTFNWSPSYGLNNITSPQVTANPTVTTTYTLQITSPSCGVKTDLVTVSVYFLNISAGADTTIHAGESITLHASPNDPSLTYVWWSPTSSVKYSSTYNPNVAPNDTTVFMLTITDTHGCSYIDYVTVNVIPSTKLIFYNSITPNNDGNNDVWIIGNLEKYPKNKLQIFNRYGQEVYSVSDYKNDWDGKLLGQGLPGGTYYYVFETQSGESKIYKGTVTIYR